MAANLKGERVGLGLLHQLAFGMGLTVEETQSMLSFRIGALYALRKRDATVMYACGRGIPCWMPSCCWISMT